MQLKTKFNTTQLTKKKVKQRASRQRKYLVLYSSALRRGLFQGWFRIKNVTI